MEEEHGDPERDVPSPHPTQAAGVLDDPAFETTIAAAFLALIEPRWNLFTTYFFGDLIESYPQSGELIRGRDQQQAMHEALNRALRSSPCDG